MFQIQGRLAVDDEALVFRLDECPMIKFVSGEAPSCRGKNCLQCMFRSDCRYASSVYLPTSPSTSACHSLTMKVVQPD